MDNDRDIKFDIAGVQISGRPWQPKCHLGDLKT